MQGARKESLLIVHMSPVGREPWTPVLPEAVPEWIKRPDIMGRLVAGEMCMDPRSVSGTDWFMAKPPSH